MTDFPRHLPMVDHVEAVPRRIRAYLGARLVVDTDRAYYVWEWPKYPQFYIPAADVRTEFFTAAQGEETTTRGVVTRHGLHAGGLNADNANTDADANADNPNAGDIVRPDAVQWLHESPIDGLSETIRFDWAALDSWFEENEQVFVHPRDPYTRVDALRGSRSIRVEFKGQVLAESAAPVLVFETGLPTRYYFDRTDIDFTHLFASDTETSCPYKGRTSGYWSVESAGRLHPDLAWAYDFPTRALAPIAGLIAFYNEKVDLFIEGRATPRPSQ